MEIEQSALVAKIDLQATKIKKLETEKHFKALAPEGRQSEIDRKRVKESNVYSIFDLRNVQVASNVLRAISAPCGGETGEKCPFDTVIKRLWPHSDENVHRNGVLVSYTSTSYSFPGY